MCCSVTGCAVLHYFLLFPADYFREKGKWHHPECASEPLLSIINCDITKTMPDQPIVPNPRESGMTLILHNLMCRYHQCQIRGAVWPFVTVRYRNLTAVRDFVRNKCINNTCFRLIYNSVNWSSTNWFTNTPFNPPPPPQGRVEPPVYNLP